MKAEDAGRYECQVSTVPKISKFFQLKVIIPKVSSDTGTGPPGGGKLERSWI